LKDNLKILHVIPYFQPEFGYEEYYHALAQSNLGHDVFIITSKYYNPNLNNGKRVIINNNISNGRLKVIRLNSIELPFSCQNILFGINRKIKKIKPNIIYAHGPENTLTLQISLLKPRSNCYYIVDKHKDGLFNKKLSLRYVFLFYKNLITSFNYKIANLIVTFSKIDTEKISNKSKSYAQKVTQQFMAVSTETFFFNQKDRDSIRKKLCFQKSDDVGIVSGRIIESKKIHLLLDEILKNQKIKLIVIGKIDNNYKKKLNRYFTDNGKVIFINEVSNNELRKYYCAADIGYWISHMSVGILEAYACELPVIINQKAKNYYPSLDNNLVVEDGDFYQALIKTSLLLNNHRKTNIVRKNARKIANGLSYNLLAKNVLSKYYNFLEK